MDDIKVLKINGNGGECFQCGTQAHYIAGGYDVCGSDECFEFAFEKAEENRAEMKRTRHALMGQSMYEASINK